MHRNDRLAPLPPVLSLLLAFIAGSAGAAPVITTALSGPNQPSTTTDEVAFAGDVSTNDLLHGIVGTGGTWMDPYGSPTGLNDGNPGGDYDAVGLAALNGTAWACDGNNVSFRDFVLGNGSYGFGFDITGIQSIAAWQGAGFSNQNYTVSVSLVGDEAFYPLTTVEYQPFGLSTTQGGSTKVNVTDDDTGVLASGVDAIRFSVLDTISDNGGGAVYREIDVFGTSTPADATPPILSTTLPADGALEVPAVSNLVATFNENIALIDGGTITMRDFGPGDDLVITLPDPQASVSGKSLIINPTADLIPDTPYAILISDAAVRDLAAVPNVFGGILDDTTWNFATGVLDDTPPTLQPPTTPADGATGVVCNSLVMTFDEPVQKGTGNVVIRKAADNSVVATIDVASMAVTVNGPEVTVALATGLPALTGYHIEVAAGAIKDLWGNPFAGFSGGSAWEFTTGAFVINNFADGSDAATGIGATTSYTHLVDILKDDADTAVINGVPFANTLADYTLVGPTNDYTEVNLMNGADPGSGMRHLLNHFRYGGTSQALTISGLTPGKTYRLRIYVSGWNGPAQTFSFDDTTPATVVSGIDRGAGQALPSSLDYTYTLGPGDTELTVTVTQQGDGSMHWYGFSNEEVGVTLPPPLRIMCLGDSITAGYTDNPSWANHPFEFGYRSGLHTLLTDAGYRFLFVGGSAEPWNQLFGDPTYGGIYTPPLDLRDLGQDGHRGYGGIAAGGLQANIVSWLASDDPDVILLKIGTNGQDTGALNTLVNTIVTNKPDAHLIVAEIMPMYTYQAGIVNYNSYIRNTLVPSYRAQGKNVTLVDQYAPFLTNPADLTSIDQSLFSNGINHPDNPGYDKMAQVWFDGIEALGIGPVTFRTWISDPAFGIDPGKQGLADDPDGDGVENGVENHFGTNPGAFSQGVVAGARSGNTFTFTHPLNDTPAADLTATYQWSKDLLTFTPGGESHEGRTVSFSPGTPSGGFVTVTATVAPPDMPLDQLFVHVLVMQE